MIAVPPYFTLLNEARPSAAASKTRLTLEQTAQLRRVQALWKDRGRCREWRERIGIDDPAHYAAWSARRMLRPRGVRMKGKARALHRPVMTLRMPCQPNLRRSRTDRAIGATLFGSVDLHAAAGQSDAAAAGRGCGDVNKVSQNLHAELLFRRIAREHAAGGTGVGLQQARLVFEQAGIPRDGYDFSDGSGMSTYNRVSPRATVALLRWGMTQPWGAAWYASFPVAGGDGTLRRRFAGRRWPATLRQDRHAKRHQRAVRAISRRKRTRADCLPFLPTMCPTGRAPWRRWRRRCWLIAAAN